MKAPASAFVLDDEEETITSRPPNTRSDLMQLTGPPRPLSLAKGTEGSLAEALHEIQENQAAIRNAEDLLRELLMQSSTLSLRQKALEQSAMLTAIENAGHTLGCHRGRPVAALLVYRCCLHWGSFEAAPPSVEQEGIASLLERLVALMAAHASEEGVERDVDGEDPSRVSSSVSRLVYWLATFSTLLALVSKVIFQQQLHFSSNNITAQAGGPTTGLANKIGAEVVHMQKAVAISGFASWAKGLIGRRGSGSAPPAVAANDVTVDESGSTSEIRSSDEVSFSKLSKVENNLLSSSEAHGCAGHSPSSQRVAVSAPPSLMVETFQCQLSLLTLRSYSQLRDSFKKRLAALLPSCVQLVSAGVSNGPLGEEAPSRSPTRLPSALPSTPLTFPAETDYIHTSTHYHNGSMPAQGQGLDKSPPRGEDSSRLEALRPWVEVVALLHDGLEAMREQAVPHIVTKCLMKQVLGFIDVQMFNQLLLRPDCCSSSNVRFMSDGLGQIDAWLAGQAGDEDTAFMASLLPELRHTRQALSFMMHTSKADLTLHDIIRVCSSLNMQQIYRLCTTFWDDSSMMPTTAYVSASASKNPQQLPPSTLISSEGGDAVDAFKEGSHDLLNGELTFDPLSVSPSEHLIDKSEHNPLAVLHPEATSHQLLAGHVGDDSATALSAADGSTIPQQQNRWSPDMVSGEVLEELRRQPQVTGNGGLIVTFLLDEDHAPAIIAQASGPAGRGAGAGSGAGIGVALDLLALIDETLRPLLASSPGVGAGQSFSKQQEVSSILYEGMPVPLQLLGPGTPRDPFVFLEANL